MIGVPGRFPCVTDMPKLGGDKSAVILYSKSPHSFVLRFVHIKQHILIFVHLKKMNRVLWSVVGLHKKLVARS